MRVTNQMQAAQLSRTLQQTYAQQAKLLDQGSSGRRITRASDDPSGAADAMGIRARAAAAAQYERNIDNGTGWLTVIDSAMSQSTDILQRVRDLALQGGSDATSATARASLAVEVDQLKEAMLSLANTTHMGRSVFAGTSDSPAFGEDYSFTGTPGATVERRVSDSETVRVDADGAAVFGEGTGSVFALLDDIAAQMRAGDNTSAAVAKIDTALGRVLSSQTTVGARQNRLERAAESVAEAQIGHTERLAAIEDVDIAELSIELQLTQMSYQASLQIGATVLSTSLLDYIR